MVDDSRTRRHTGWWRRVAARRTGLRPALAALLAIAGMLVLAAVALAAGAPKSTQPPVLSGIHSVGQQAPKSTEPPAFSGAASVGQEASKSTEPPAFSGAASVGQEASKSTKPPAFSGTASVGQAAPKSTEPPVFSGPPSVGQELGVSEGTWEGAEKYTYEWDKCQPTTEGPSCKAIEGATEPYYVPTAEDEGHTLKAVVIAENTAGKKSASSAETATVTVQSGGPAEGWGRDYPGEELGSGYSNQFETAPVPVLGLSDVHSVVSAGYGSFALLGNGEAMAWGTNDRKGELGDGTREASGSPVHMVERPAAGKPRTMTGVTAISDTFGALTHGLALREGKVLAWGASEYGERGNGEYQEGVDSEGKNWQNSILSEEERWDATPVPGLEHLVAIATGGNANFAIEKQGSVRRLWAWGGNHFGMLGIGKEDERADREAQKRVGTPSCKGEGVWMSCVPKPVEVKLKPDGAPLPPNVTVRSISAGRTAAYAVLSNGKVLAWGGNEEGELGNGTNQNSDKPEYVCKVGVRGPCSEGEALEGVESVSGGVWFALALKNNGEVVGWGSNDAGQLSGESHQPCGHSVGQPVCQLTPKVVKGLSGEGEGVTRHVIAISAGNYSSLALVNGKEKGEVFSFGESARGQLGYPKTEKNSCSTKTKKYEKKQIGCCPAKIKDEGEATEKALEGTQCCPIKLKTATEERNKETVTIPFFETAQCNRKPTKIDGLSNVGGVSAGNGPEPGEAHSFAYLAGGPAPRSPLTLEPKAQSLKALWTLASPMNGYELVWKQVPPPSDKHYATAKKDEEEQHEYRENAAAARGACEEGEAGGCEELTNDLNEVKKYRARAAGQERLADIEYPSAREEVRCELPGPVPCSRAIKHAWTSNKAAFAPLSGTHAYQVRLRRTGIYYENEEYINTDTIVGKPLEG